MDTKLIQSIYEMLLVGASRTSFSTEQLQALHQLGMDTSLPSEALLLQCLVYFQQWEKVGMPLEYYPEVLPSE